MPKRLHILLYILLSISTTSLAQFEEPINDGGFGGGGGFDRRNQDKEGGNNKEIPVGLKVWQVDERFGDRRNAEPDTLSPMFMNTIFTTGLRGEYNTLGNLGSPRINRIFIDRQADGQFIFTQPYDFFIKRPQDFLFTNTLSPITNLTYNTCGDRLNGEDHFTAKFGVNVNKRLGFGANFDYIYGRGYYDSQSTSHANYTLYGSYLGERYEAHLLASLNHQKVAENGGITDDDYIVHPESFRDSYTTSEIPVVLRRNWNRNDNQHVFFTHRYNVGFNRKVRMTDEEIEARKFAIASQQEQAEKKRLESADSLQNMAEEAAPIDTTWMKNEYVPVTSFIHTLHLDNYRRIYQGYQTPKGYYAHTFPTVAPLSGDSIYDKTGHFAMKNTFAIALLEGFNKYAKAGLKGFVAHEMKHFTLPDSTTRTESYNEHTVYVGGQISKTEGTLLHYDATAEFGVAGANSGEVTVDGQADLNFRLLGDTVQLAAKGFFHLQSPTFYYTHYHSRHFWWDNDDLDKTAHTRIEGILSWQRTHTQLRVAVDDISKYAYFGTSYQVDSLSNRLGNTVTPRQCGDNISLLTVSLQQSLKYKIMHLDARLTYQKSSKEDIIPLPRLNLYANLYLRFKIAHVLDCDMGADVRFFTSYYAPDFVPGIAQYAVQENHENRVKVGNYPFVNVYANFFLKHARFFVMMSHVNSPSDGGKYFLTPHYPTNQRLLRFGVSWNFFN